MTIEAELSKTEFQYNLESSYTGVSQVLLPVSERWDSSKSELGEVMASVVGLGTERWDKGR